MIERFQSSRPIVISPEVMSPAMLSYLAQNVIMPSRATSLTSPCLHIYSIVSSHESLRNLTLFEFIALHLIIFRVT